MSTPPPLSAQEARTQRHLEYLDTLIAQGMDLATRLHQQSTTPSDLCSALAAPDAATPAVTPETIASFAQINQTVRRAILVSRKLAEPLPLARPSPYSAPKCTPSEIENPTNSGTEPASTEPASTEPVRTETLRAESADRLHSPDLEDRIGARLIPQIIAGICRDLGLDPDPSPGKCHAPDDPAPAAQPCRAPTINGHDDDTTEAVPMALQRCSKPDPRPPRR